MSDRFTLADNSVDSKTILDKIITMGIPRTHVTCIQRFRSGQVDVRFAIRELRELFLSKVATTFERRPTAPRLTWQSGIYMTVRDAPWELPDDLIKQHLQKIWDRLFDSTGLYSKPLTRKSARWTAGPPYGREAANPPFMKFGPFVARIFYLEQPRVCWKCNSPDDIGRACPEHHCFNCDHTGHQSHTCEERIKCSLCKSEEHLAIDCPGNWGRRTLAERTPHREDDSKAHDETDKELTSQASGHTSGTEEDSERDRDDSQRDEEDEINDDDPQTDEGGETIEVEEDSEVIEQFTSSEPDTDPPLPQRKRGGRVAKHVKKKSRIEENNP